MTGGDEDGTEVDRVPQRADVCVRRARQRDGRGVREVPVPRAVAAPQDAPQLRRGITTRSSYGISSERR
jgi:hypothetical protein